MDTFHGFYSSATGNNHKLPLEEYPRHSTLYLSQEPITWSEQIPYWAYVMVSSQTSLFLDTF